MSKAKLHEYCQKYRLQNPQYFTTNVPPLFTSIVILGLGLSKPQEFLSRESHSTKKKAENDAAEVALNAIEKFDGDLFDNPALVQPTLRTDDLVSSIWKAVEASNTGIFSDKIWVPVEYLLLFSGVRSAVNRIDQKHKWDTSLAFDCLLEALFTKKQNFLQVQTRNTRVMICKVAEFALESAEQSQQVLKPSCVSHDPATLTSFIVLPASEVRAPYEVNITFISESNDGGSNDVQRMVKMFDMMSAQLNIAGNFAISRPLFITAEQRGDGKQLSSSLPVLLSAPDDLEVRPAAGQKATVGQPRLFTQHQDIRDGTRNVKEGAVLNKVASWISSYPVYGDAVISCMDMTSTAAATLEHLKAVLHSSLPSGLWTLGSAERSFLSLPTWYYPAAWDGSSKDSVAVKKPSHVLQEIMSRRSEASGFSKSELSCASELDSDDVNASASLVFEDVPMNGWWSKGVEVDVQHVDSLKRTAKKAEVKKAPKGELITVQITLPTSKGLFATSGRVFSSSEEVEKGCAEASEVTQGLCLDALQALQSCGMDHLNHLPSHLKPYFDIPAEIPSSSTTTTPTSSSSSAALPSSSSLRPPTPSLQDTELGEDSAEDVTEGSGDARSKKDKILLLKFQVTPLLSRDSTSKRKNTLHDDVMMEVDGKYSLPNTDTSLNLESGSRSSLFKNSQQSTHTDEERNPKKIRYETADDARDGHGDMTPLPPSTTVNFTSEAVKATVECIQSTVTDSEGNAALYDGRDLTGPGYILSAFTGMGMIPQGMELELSTRPLGESFTVSYPCNMGACLSARPAGAVHPSSSSSSSSSSVATPFENSTAAGCDVEADTVMENGASGSAGNGDVTATYTTVQDVSDTNYSYEIRVLERKVHDSQPRNKKAKPNLFYPSLSTQRRRLLAAFLRAGNVSSWLDIGCGTCVVMESLLLSNVSSSAPAPSSSAVASVSVSVPALESLSSPAMDCVAGNSMAVTTADGEESINGSSHINAVSADYCDSNMNSLNQRDAIVNSLNATVTASDSNTSNSSSRSVRSGSHQAQADSSMRIPTLKHITGLEYNIDPLKVAKKRLLAKLPRKEDMESDFTSFSLWHGSILDEGVERDMQTGSEKDISHCNSSLSEPASNSLHSSSRRFQAISCIEVIEHLPTEEDAAYALKKVLCDFQPEYALFSTPNYESNYAIRTAAAIKPRKKSLNTGEGEPSVEGSNKEGAVQEEPNPDSFREADHKFEFTREQFRDWAYAGLMASGGQYEVQFTEVGSGLPGMGGCEKGPLRGQEEGMLDVECQQGASSGEGGQVQGGDALPAEDSTHREGLLCGLYTDEDGTLQRSRDRGCGGASQVAIFRRKKASVGADITRIPAGADAAEKGAKGGDKPATLFWSWDRDGSIEDDRGGSEMVM